MNRASEGDRTPGELFQILKDDAVKVLHLICQQIWKIQQWPQDWKRSVFIPIPKKDNASSVHFSHSVISNSVTPWTAACQASLSITTPRAYSDSCSLSLWCHPKSHPLSSPSPPAFNLSQHQGLFKWVSSSHQVAKILEFQLQSFQTTPRTDFL